MSVFDIIFAGKKPDKEISSFEVVTLRTSGMRAVCEYEIVMKGERAEVSEYRICFSGEEDERVLERRAQCSEGRILELLNNCRLLSWDGFYGKHPKGLLDGTMFRLKANVNGGKSIFASGSQNFPKHYRDFTDGLYDILNNRERQDMNDKEIINATTKNL